jgi:hypothetical protein
MPHSAKLEAASTLHRRRLAWRPRPILSLGDPDLQSERTESHRPWNVGFHLSEVWSRWLIGELQLLTSICSEVVIAHLPCDGDQLEAAAIDVPLHIKNAAREAHAGAYSSSCAHLLVGSS